MEILVGFILILVLIFCTGAPISTIIAVILGAVGLVVLLILGFFIICDILLCGSEKKTAVFSKIAKSPRTRFDCAYYLVDGTEYPNAFPCEIALRKRLYVPQKQVTVRLVRKMNMVFDSNAFIATISGTAVFAVLLTAAVSGIWRYFF